MSVDWVELDSCLSLLWHRHVRKADVPDEVAYRVESALGVLREQSNAATHPARASANAASGEEATRAQEALDRLYESPSHSTRFAAYLDLRAVLARLAAPSAPAESEVDAKREGAMMLLLVSVEGFLRTQATMVVHEASGDSDLAKQCRSACACHEQAMRLYAGDLRSLLAAEAEARRGRKANP